jgi:hypothetical protein
MIDRISASMSRFKWQGRKMVRPRNINEFLKSAIQLLLEKNGFQSVFLII